MSDAHLRTLESMYRSAPINGLYGPDIEVWPGKSEIQMDVRPEYFHAAGAVHGSVYFKMLDDAAYFAAASLEREFFVVTTTFTTYLTRPVSEGRLRALGQAVQQNRSQFIVEAVLWDDQDRELSRGSGLFVRSKLRLSEVETYRLGQEAKGA